MPLHAVPYTRPARAQAYTRHGKSDSRESGRIKSGRDAIDNDDNAGVTEACVDGGHGTHVAGTVGGATWGVAKGVTLVAVRVLDCTGSGTNEQVIAGIDWVTGDVQKAAGDPTRVGGLPAVANMGLGGGASDALDAAVARSTAAGITYAVAAGNGYQNACDGSPAKEASAIRSVPRTYGRRATFPAAGLPRHWAPVSTPVGARLGKRATT